MARAPYPHIEAPGKVYIDGTLAFTKGDPIPLQTAKDRNIPYTDADVFEGTAPADMDGFTDAVIIIDPADEPAPGGDPAPATPPAGKRRPTSTAPEGAPA